ncbi:MAG TPA: YceI family protein [Terriglobales bacterium]
MNAVVKPEVTTSTWNIDPAHTNAQFKVKHLMISNVKGEFTSVKGKAEINDADITKSYVEATIDTTSINTREPQRDAHLKSADFFDVDKYPTMTFKSTRISREGEDELGVEGELTIHGVTRKVVFDVKDLTPPAKDPWGNTRFGFEATTKINRKDFGLTWNATLETGGFMVGDEVTITLDAEFVKA